MLHANRVNRVIGSLNAYIMSKREMMLLLIIETDKRCIIYTYIGQTQWEENQPPAESDSVKASSAAGLASKLHICGERKSFILFKFSIDIIYWIIEDLKYYGAWTKASVMGLNLKWDDYMIEIIIFSFGVTMKSEGNGKI